MRLTLFVLASAGLVLPGCTATKTFAKDTVSAVKAIPRPHLPSLDPPAYSETAEGVAAYCEALQVRFDYGRDLVGAGNELVVDGRKQVSNGAYRIRTGENKVNSAEIVLSNARRELGLKLNKDTPTTTDFELLYDPRRHSRIQTELKNGVLIMERGREMIEIGELEVSEGRAKIDRGIDFIREGQDIMQEDEGRCRRYYGN